MTSLNHLTHKQQSKHQNVINNSKNSATVYKRSKRAMTNRKKTTFTCSASPSFSFPASSSPFATSSVFSYSPLPIEVVALFFAPPSEIVSAFSSSCLFSSPFSAPSEYLSSPLPLKVVIFPLSFSPETFSVFSFSEFFFSPFLLHFPPLPLNFLLHYCFWRWLHFHLLA